MNLQYMCDVGADRTDIRSQLHQTTIQSSTLVVTLFVLEEEGVVVQVNNLFSLTLHCKEISIYVFPEKELRGFSPNFHFICL
jgi:hypothetical protein